MNTVDVNWKCTTKVLWSFWWRWTLVSFLAGVALGFIVGLVSDVLAIGGMGVAADRIAAFMEGPFAEFAFLPILIPIAFWAMRAALIKQYSDFRIKLVPRSGDAAHVLKYERDAKSESATPEPDQTQEPPRTAAA